MAIDLSDPAQGPNSAIGVGGEAPFGSLVVNRWADTVETRLLDVDADGLFESVPLVPPSTAWTTRSTASERPSTAFRVWPGSRSKTAPRAELEVVTQTSPGFKVSNTGYTDGWLLFESYDGQSGSASVVDLSGPTAGPILPLLTELSGAPTAASFPVDGVGTRLLLTATPKEGTRQILAIDLDDPALTLIDLGTALPEDWTVSIGFRTSDDRSQIVFRIRPIVGENDTVLALVRGDEAGSFQQLSELGYEIGNIVFFEP